MSDWLSYFTPAQLVGVLASCFAIAAYGVKDDQKTKYFLILECGLFAVHFYMMAAFTAVGVMIVNVFRVWLSVRYHGIFFLCLFFVLTYLLVGALTFEYPIDILTLVPPVVSTVAMYCFSGVRFRMICLLATGCWLIYGVLIGSFGLILTQVVVSSVNVFTIYRLQKDKNNEQKT